MTIEEIIEIVRGKIRLLEIEWHKESNNDILTYLNGQLTAYQEILRQYENSK